MKYIDNSEINDCQNICELASHIKYLVSMGGFNNIETPLRNIFFPKDRISSYGAMMAVSPELDLFICKSANFIADNKNFGRTTVNALVTAFSYHTGLPLAVLEGAAITNLKCAAITAFFTDIASQDSADKMAIIGTGVQAANQLQGVTAVRGIKTVKVFSRDQKNIEHFISHQSSQYPELHFIGCQSIDEALSDTEIIGTATTSKIPIIETLKNTNVHVNCLGGHTTTTREISRELLSVASLLVEDKETAVKEAGAIHDTAIDLLSPFESYTTDLKQKLTVFSSTGHGSIDLVTVYHVLQKLGINNNG